MSRNQSNLEGELLNVTCLDPLILANNHSLTIPNSGTNTSFVMSGLGSSAVYTQLTSNSTNIPITTTFGKFTMFDVIPANTAYTFNLTGSLIKTTSNIMVLNSPSVNNASNSGFTILNLTVSNPTSGSIQLNVANHDVGGPTPGSPIFYFFIM